MRKQFTLVASLAFAAALSAGFAVANVTANAAETKDGFAITATSVRYDDPAKEGVDSGLRFKIDVPAGATVTDAYTAITVTPVGKESVSTNVEATVWRNDGSGWNTVLLDIPASDYATEVTAQAFATIDGVAYETAAVTSSIAKTASIVMNEQNAIDETLNAYVNNVESLSVDEEALSMKDGESKTLTATIAPADYKVVWTSSNANVATVDKDGNVTAKKAGTANITAQMGDKTATCAVTVEYNALYDFENGTVPSIFTAKTSEEISVDTYNGSNVLKMHVESGSAPGMYISADYLAWAFANTSVEAISFDLTLASAVSDTGKVALYRKLASATKEQVGKAVVIGETRTITITRADYETFAADTSEKAGEWSYYWSSKSADDSLTWYVDNVALAIQETGYQDTYNFDDGKGFDLFVQKTSEEISIDTYNGSSALKLYVEYAANAGMYISADYLAWAFADASVQSLSFELTLASVVASDDTIVEKVTLYRKLASATKEQVGKAVVIGETRTITITRADYETFVADTSDKAGEWSYYWNKSASYAMTWYVDNLQRNK